MDSILMRAGIFQGVAPSAVAELTGELGRITFPRGHVVFSEGELGDRLHVIVSGKVKLSTVTSDGRESVIALMGPPDMFGELAVFDPGPRTSTATALTELRTVTLDRTALMGWIRQHPEIADQLLRVLARRLRRTNDVMTDMIFTDVPGRVAKQLLHLAKQFGVSEGKSLRVDHELTQVEIAQLIGSSRETVNKALSDFMQRGWIRLQGKTVFIDNPARLARRAGGPLHRV